jgi:hypothetical protein
LPNKLNRRNSTGCSGYNVPAQFKLDILLRHFDEKMLLAVFDSAMSLRKYIQNVEAKSKELESELEK